MRPVYGSSLIYNLNRLRSFLFNDFSRHVGPHDHLYIIACVSHWFLHFNNLINNIIKIGITDSLDEHCVYWTPYIMLLWERIQSMFWYLILIFWLLASATFEFSLLIIRISAPEFSCCQVTNEPPVTFLSL